MEIPESKSDTSDYDVGQKQWLGGTIRILDSDAGYLRLISKLSNRLNSLLRVRLPSLLTLFSP